MPGGHNAPACSYHHLHDRVSVIRFADKEMRERKWQKDRQREKKGRGEGEGGGQAIGGWARRETGGGGNGDMQDRGETQEVRVRRTKGHICSHHGLLKNLFGKICCVLQLGDIPSTKRYGFPRAAADVITLTTIHGDDAVKKKPVHHSV